MWKCLLKLIKKGKNLHEVNQKVSKKENLLVTSDCKDQAAAVCFFLEVFIILVPVFDSFLSRNFYFCFCGFVEGSVACGCGLFSGWLKQPVFLPTKWLMMGRQIYMAGNRLDIHFTTLGEECEKCTAAWTCIFVYIVCVTEGKLQSVF